MKVEELALQRKRYAHLSDEEWRWMLQQVEGRQRTHDKLPTFAQIEDWWYPVRLSCEQCSSEATARYKAAIIRQLGKKQDILIDLTGGYGVDTYFLSEQTTQAHYVERNEGRSTMFCWLTAACWKARSRTPFCSVRSPWALALRFPTASS